MPPSRDPAHRAKPNKVDLELVAKALDEITAGLRVGCALDQAATKLQAAARLVAAEHKRRLLNGEGWTAVTGDAAAGR